MPEKRPSNSDAGSTAKGTEKANVLLYLMGKEVFLVQQWAEKMSLGVLLHL
jgi:hypothetical protein